jgi:hypothetical protein
MFAATHSFGAEFMWVQFVDDTGKINNIKVGTRIGRKGKQSSSNARDK